MILPEPEPLLVAALRAQSAVAALVGTRVATRLSGTYPAIRVALVGGPSRPTTNTGRPELQVECWGNGADSTAEGEASEIAMTVEGVAENLAGTYPTGRIVSAYARPPFHAVDATTGRERFILTVGLVTQP